VIADLKVRANGAPDGGQSIADWLSQYGIVTKGASFAESLSVVEFTSDAELAAVAAALGVAE
jgi:hypothetical protein